MVEDISSYNLIYAFTHNADNALSLSVKFSEISENRANNLVKTSDCHKDSWTKNSLFEQNKKEDHAANIIVKQQW